MRSRIPMKVRAVLRAISGTPTYDADNRTVYQKSADFLRDPVFQRAYRQTRWTALPGTRSCDPDPADRAGALAATSVVAGARQAYASSGRPPGPRGVLSAEGIHRARIRNRSAAAESA